MPLHGLAVFKERLALEDNPTLAAKLVHKSDLMTMTSQKETHLNPPNSIDCVETLWT